MTKKRKNTARRARLLENGIHALRLRGFKVFDGIAAFRKYRKQNEMLPPRYILAPFPCETLYGTHGRKESLIHCDERGDFIFEAKYQDDSGSVDEKAPYLWECFLISPQNWIVWFDGNWFVKDQRGRAVVGWLKRRAGERSTAGRSMHVVCGNTEFYQLIDRLFPESGRAWSRDDLFAQAGA